MKKLVKTNINSLKISNDRLVEFTKLFEVKTGKKLSDEEILVKAETLLRTVSLLYKPINKLDYYKADVAYPLLRKPLDKKT
jgi:hypothetical protein